MRRLKLLTGLLLLSAAMTAQDTNVYQKMSPQLQWLVRTQNTYGQHQAAQRDQQVSMLLKLRAEADTQETLQRHGATLLRSIGRVLVASVPLSNVMELAQDPDVVRIEAERAPRRMTDITPGLTGVDKVQQNAGSQLPQAYTGKGVVVGIVDSGFDYIHPSFRDAEGKTRIGWAKDYLTGQTLTSKEAVTQAMHSSDAATMYHGTHVASIAAGSRVEDADWEKPKTYQGMATEADIAEGCIDSELTATGLSTTTSLLAFADIFDYAESQGKPCVINYSLGDAMSFSDSRQLEEEAIRTLLQKPGRALVVAAGNAGSTKRLAHKTAAMAEGGAGVCFNDVEQYGTYLGLELKVKPSQTVTLRYMDSSYQTSKGEVSKTGKELETATTLKLGNKDLMVMQKQTGNDYDVVYVTAGTRTTFSTQERLLVTIEGEGEAWIYADPMCAQLENVSQKAGHQLAEDGYSMAWPATMDEVISVGNIAHRFKILTTANKYAMSDSTDLTPYESTKGAGYLAQSSSVGPTLQGGMKPDVCAPGVNIIAAESFFIDDDTYYALAGWDIAALDTEYETWGSLQGYFHIMAQTGTSMSAPAVAGIIALWMQADPTLTTDRIKDIIAHSSRQPDSELDYPNNQYGHGEIDAYQGLLYMLGLTGIKELTQHQPQQTRIELRGNTLQISFAAGQQPRQVSVRLYSTDGRLLLSTSETSIALDSLPKGVYAVQVSTGQKSTTGSTLIRK